MKNANRRKSPRLPIHIRTFVDSTNRRMAATRTVDLSAGGALLDSPFPFRQGQSLRIRFTSPETGIRSVEARVVRTESAFWGKRFLVAVEFHQTLESVKPDLAKMMTSEQAFAGNSLENPTSHRIAG